MGRFLILFDKNFTYNIAFEEIALFLFISNEIMAVNHA